MFPQAPLAPAFVLKHTTLNPLYMESVSVQGHVKTPKTNNITLGYRLASDLEAHPSTNWPGQSQKIHKGHPYHEIWSNQPQIHSSLPINWGSPVIICPHLYSPINHTVSQARITPIHQLQIMDKKPHRYHHWNIIHKYNLDHLRL